MPMRDALEGITCIVVNVAAMTITNYATNVARTEIDFPIVPLQMAA